MWEGRLAGQGESPPPTKAEPPERPFKILSYAWKPLSLVGAESQHKARDNFEIVCPQPLPPPLGASLCLPFPQGLAEGPGAGRLCCPQLLCITQSHKRNLKVTPLDGISAIKEPGKEGTTHSIKG